MSVLFSDVRGFTTLSEGLSPRELTRLMNEMLTPLTEVIHKRRGTIDKYMGDAIMAYTVLGDTVNLGSRLEGLTKQYGVDVIVSGATARAVPDFMFRELDAVRVKGKHEPVSIFEPLGPRGELDTQRVTCTEQFHEVLRRYRLREFRPALRLLEDLARDHSPLRRCTSCISTRRVIRGLSRTIPARKHRPARPRVRRSLLAGRRVPERPRRACGGCEASGRRDVRIHAVPRLRTPVDRPHGLAE